MTTRTPSAKKSPLQPNHGSIAPPSGNLLTEAVIGIRLRDHSRQCLSLPQVLAHLSDDDIAAFTGLQAHQTHAWHAFLVQLAAMAIARSGSAADLPIEAGEWASLLRALTDARDEPWCMVVPDLQQPAFMQPPVPERSVDRFKAPVAHPDELDVLVTSKNHDVKSARMACPSLEHWVYALISLQTMEGYSGRDNYGIARMNSGFGSRPGIGFTPGHSLGGRFRRDVRVATDTRMTLLNSDVGYSSEGGLALLWMMPWDGKRSLELQDCDPLFIEICRRVRLLEIDGRIVARVAPTKVPLLAASERKGDTGDPWTPIRLRDGAALTLSGEGFTYDLTQELLLGADYRPGPAATLVRADADDMLWTGQVLVRGQGKTEGFHHRTVPVPGRVRRLLAQPDSRDRIAARARARVERAATARRSVLHPALCALLQGGPEKIDFRDDRTRPWTRAFDRAVDRLFFDSLWSDSEATEDVAAARWNDILRRLVREQLQDAIGSVPLPSARRYRAISAAERMLAGLSRKHLGTAETEELPA